VESNPNNDIFSAAGFSKLSGSVMAIIIGATHVPATLLGMLLIDRWGRKTLLLVGSVGCAAPLIAIAEIFHTHQHLPMLLFWMMDSIFFFSISQGAVIWVKTALPFAIAQLWTSIWIAAARRCPSRRLVPLRPFGKSRRVP